jgi:hypothetical protein
MHDGGTLHTCGSDRTWACTTYRSHRTYLDMRKGLGGQGYMHTCRSSSGVNHTYASGFWSSFPPPPPSGRRGNSLLAAAAAAVAATTLMTEHTAVLAFVLPSVAAAVALSSIKLLAPLTATGGGGGGAARSGGGGNRTRPLSVSRPRDRGCRMRRGKLVNQERGRWG